MLFLTLNTIGDYICISFFQQCNNGEELHYTTQKEALAMVCVLHKFWHYLLGNKFVFYVHHMTFPYLIKKSQVYRIIAIWLSHFLKCNLSIIYKPKHSHSIANALSLQQRGAILRSKYHHKQQRKMFAKSRCCEP
jgi:hypothetical protein